ncbi:asparagine synthase C-terminal domain-containing protein [Candidatus Woesearchaeota archaeon]|nr:asparagine synthase C-terminal domain-containing protein [Candidatus Woesearchaeota archaeon]
MELMPEAEWQRWIDEIRFGTKPSTKEEMANWIFIAVISRIPSVKFGVLLSGGVDSSLIARILSKEGAVFTCYSVGLEGADDLAWAKKVAEFIERPLRQKVCTLDEADAYFRKAATIVPVKDVLSIGVGAVEIAAAEMAVEDGVEVLFGGLGSEEIFAGYERHQKAADVHEECWRGLRDVMWKRDLTRDFAVANALGITFKTPFLDEHVIKAAMGIDASRKINSQHKKVILREIAEDLGLPHEVAWRAKKAAQYGSKLDWAMEKLAAKHGFQTKAEYVASL